MQDVITKMVDRVRKEIKEKGSFKLYGIAYYRKILNISEGESDKIVENRLDDILNKLEIKVNINENVISFEKIDGSEILDKTIIDIYTKKEIEGDEYLELIKQVMYSSLLSPKLGPSG